MTTLAEAIGGRKRVIGGPFGSKLTTRDYAESGVPVIRGSNMEVNGRFIEGPFAFVTEQKVSKDLGSNLAYAGDVIVTQRGTLGQVSVVPGDTNFEKYVVSQSQMAISVDPTFADRDFVYYYLRSPAFADYSHNQTIQTGVPHINLGILRDAPTNFPCVSDQREIAAVLGALDDKIEVNRKTAATLEAMARALYRSWFVDFDPVHARSQGQPPAHMDQATADLFPDRFAQAALPDGWSRVPTSEIVSFTKGRSYKSVELQPSSTALISLKSFKRGGGYRTDGLKSYTGTYKPEQVVSPGEIVISLTDVTQAAELIARATFARSSTEFNTLVASLDVGILRPIDPERTPQEFLHQCFNSTEFLDHALAHTSGTTVLHLAKEAVPNYEMLVPEPAILACFQGITGPMRDRVFRIEEENQTLATLRDTLLPKLMSGEVRVGAAREQVEEVI